MPDFSLSISQPRIIRDPLWNTIRVDPVAARIMDTPAFQRLRYIRQLGLAHLVYPGATHTRFDHALGVYHLAGTAVRLLRDRGGVPEHVWEGVQLIPYAALLHDIGHFAFSHALEELDQAQLPGDHEAMSGRFFASAELGEALAPLGPDAPARIQALIQGRSAFPLQGLVNGSLDLDKMEYLRRDARFAGVPYGEVDVDRLLQGLMLLPDPMGGSYEVGMHEKAASALESLLFARYQMFRNVYWHHAVRSATVLYKRIVEDSVAGGLLRPDELIGPTDEWLLFEIGRRAGDGSDPISVRLRDRWLPALWNRRLPKRAVEITASELDGRRVADWVTGAPDARRRREDELAREYGLPPGELFVDYPAKAMFKLNLLVLLRSGEVTRMGDAGLQGLIDLPRLARELYQTTRVLRVFTLQRTELDRGSILKAVTGNG
ncbi:MAG: HD domain-containing protein [Gemmatimonadota bacterium]